MKVQCVICDRFDNFSDDLPEAKKLRNRPIHTYMCTECHDRIADKTYARIATGNSTFSKALPKSKKTSNII